MTRYRFEGFELWAETGELFRQGVKIHLQQQPAQILQLLLSRPGELVTRQEIANRLWGGDTFTDFDQGVHIAVKKLRDALGDSAAQPRLIETLPRRGYRFIGQVTVDNGGGRPAEPRRFAWTVFAGVLAVLVVVLLSLTGWTASVWLTARGKHNPRTLTTRPMTAAPGIESSPDFSPDGLRVAYLWRKPGHNAPDIFVKVLGGGNPAQLTQSPDIVEVSPTWSPDGNWIAFFSVRESRAHLSIIPSSGGQERMVGPETWLSTSGLCWTQDGQALIAPVVEGPYGLPALYAVSVTTGERRKLMQPPSAEGDLYPAVSPDGRTLAFVRIGNFGILRKIHLAGISPGLHIVGEVRPIDSTIGSIHGVDWIGKTNRLIYSVGYSASGTTTGFWSVGTDGKDEPQLVFPLPGVQAFRGSLSPEGDRLTYFVIQNGNTGMWRIDLGGDPAVEIPLREIPTAPVTNLNIAVSPDSQRIAYASNRSGGLEIWTSRIDGSEPRQITDRPGEKSGTPRWSPDGSRIAFDSSTAGNSDVFVTNSTGGAPIRVTSHRAVDSSVAWSADGDWLYFSSNRTGEFQIWKTPVSGGNEIQLTRNGGFGGVESLDGRYFYYTTLYQSGELRRVPAWGGFEETVYPKIHDVHSLRATARGIYFLTPCPECDARKQPYDLHRFRSPNGPVEVVGRFRLPVRMGFSVAHDDSFIVVNGIRPSLTSTGNIMLVDGLP